MLSLWALKVALKSTETKVQLASSGQHLTGGDALTGTIRGEGTADLSFCPMKTIL